MKRPKGCTNLQAKGVSAENLTLFFLGVADSERRISTPPSFAWATSFFSRLG